jgi:ABC-type uncharacterized transport system involved in gliding motility auxiliary subunit
VTEPTKEPPAPPASTAGAPRRSLVEGSLWSAGVALVAALVLLLNYFGFKYYQRFDWTGSKIYSLSPKTESVLEGLDRDVTVTALMRPGAPLEDVTRELLDRYAAKSRRLAVRHVDPERNLLETNRLVEQYGLATATDVVVFESGEDRRVVDSSKLAEYDYSGLQFGGEPSMTAFKGEEAFTGAILELVERRKPKVLFTSGHGERALEEPGPDGLSRVRELLGAENVEIETWPTLGATEVPAGTDLVVIASPRVAFVAPELELLGRFLDGGGRLLALLDPELDGKGGLVATGLEPLLAGRGVELGDDLVVDPSAVLPTMGAETIFVRSSGLHPIVESLGQAQYPVLVALARSVRPGDAPAGAQVQTLLETTSEGWAETDLANLTQVARGEADRPGPVPIGIAVGPGAGDDGPPGFDEHDLLEEGEGGASAPKPEVPWRLVVIGDSDFATNSVLPNVGNPTLLANAFNWLLERPNRLGIGPKQPEQARLSLTSGQLAAITWGVLAGLPALAAAAGFGVWLRRRR